MNMKVLSVMALCLSACAAFGARAKGDCMASAIALSPGQGATVTLVDEYDTDLKENLGGGVAVYRMTLRKGQAYTVWITGGATSELMLDVGSDWTKDTAAWAAFDYGTFAGGATEAAFLYSDSWDEEDPAADYFYITISGDIGQTCNLYTAQGIMTFNVEGEESSPKVLTITDVSQKSTQSFLDGEYYFSAQLVGGRKYMFRTTGGSASNELFLDFDGEDFDQLPDPAHSNDTFNSSWLLYPQQTMTYMIHAMGNEGNFNLKYQSFPSRKPKKHPFVQLDASNEFKAEVKPGRVAADPAFYDDIIDETLCRVAVKAGERWLFQTQGAAGRVLMRVYDANGVLLRENDTMGDGTYDVRCVVEADADTNYYVGVCDAGLTYDNAPESTLPALTLFAARAEDYGVRDVWDETGDDALDGASLITPFPVSSDVTEIDPLVHGEPHEGHTLSASDWYDYFAFAGRKGVTYAFKTDFAGDSENLMGWLLSVKVYKAVAGSASKWNGTVAGNLTPASANYGNTSSLKFTADEDGMYYLRISVSKGVGLDYPEYTLYSCAYQEGVDLGLLRVKTEGVDSTWYLRGSSALFSNGAVLALPTSESNKVKFSDQGGFVTPASVTTNLVAWTGEDSSLTEIVGRYVDTSDPADNVSSGYVSITPEKKSQNAKRTLWQNDSADYFRFKAVEGVYYNFWLTDTTETGTSDAVMTIIGRYNDTPEVEGVTEYRKQSFAPEKYYVKVTHAQSPAADSSYRLYYSCANVGTVQFSQSTSYKISEDAAYVDLTVTRTASEGAVRVHYATFEGTAVPGKEYYPTNGVLAWADGDMSPKTIRVRLIPDLEPEYEGSEHFYVKIWPMEKDALEEDEYEATIPEGLDVADVKVKESKEFIVGKVKVRGPLVVTADETLMLGIGRTGGDGKVAIRVKTQSGTALAGTDYVHIDTNLVWESGEVSDKFIPIETIGNGSLVDKQFNVKLYVLNTDAYSDCATPVLTAQKAYITIESEVIGETQGDVAAKAAANGVTLANTKTWFEDAATGSFRSAPVAVGSSAKAKFTVTGPGFFIATPQIMGGMATLSCTTGGVAVACAPGEKFVLPVASTEPVTVMFKIAQSDGDAYCQFEKQDNGLPFKWLPLSSVTPVEPREGAVVGPSQSMFFAWKEPTGKAATDGLCYRVRLGGEKAKSSKITTVVAQGMLDATCPYDGAALTAGKQYWWMIDYAYSEEVFPDLEKLEWVTGPSIWSFSVRAAGAPATRVLDMWDRPLVDQAAGIPVELVQGVYARYTFAAEEGSASRVALLSGGLPKGLQLKDTKLKFNGVPSKVYATEKPVVLGVVDSKERVGSTVALVFTIKELGVGAGSFCGALVEDGMALTNGYPRVGRLTFTAAVDGTISANAKIAGRTYKFSSTTGYDEANDAHTEATVALEQVETINGVTYTNVLEVTSQIGSATNLVNLGGVIAKARLTVNVPDADLLGVQREIVYACDLYRDNTASAEYVAALADFAGYYTVSLVPFGVQALDGVPCGNGYLTMTIAANGTATYAGRLADGTEFSGSTSTQLLGDLAQPASCELCVPITLRASPYSFGGVLKIKNGVIDSLAELEWNKDGKYSSFDRMGFRIPVRPTGGWYSTVSSLQTYYLDRDFWVETEPIDGIPASMLLAGYSYVAQTTPVGVGLTLAGNVLTPETRAWVTEDGSSTRNDFSASVNPWKVKTSFVRETGLVTGTFQAWADDGATQTNIGSMNHYGVLLMNRDAVTPLDADVWTAGFYLMPVTSKWTLSMPFNIRSLTVDRDWSEVEIPVVK